MPPNGCSIWHYEPDSAPEVWRSPQGDAVVALRLGVFCPDGVAQPFVTFAYTQGGVWQQPMGMTPLDARISDVVDLRNRLGNPPPDGLEARLASLHPADLVAAGRNPQNRYYEATLPPAPEGVLLEYSLVAHWPDGSTSTADGCLLPVCPADPVALFDRASLVAARHTTDLIDPPWIALYAPYPVGDVKALIRIDVPDLNEQRPRITLGTAGTTWAMTADPNDRSLLPTLPQLDLRYDEIVIPITAEVTVLTVNGVDYAVGGADYPADAGARLMLIGYGIQSCNDLFETPIDDGANGPEYLTYLQVTMRDAAARYGSRTDKASSGFSDGYAYTIDTHHKYGVPLTMAVNSGFLTLLAQDGTTGATAGGSPEPHLDNLRALVTQGLVDLAPAGFGAHRQKYFLADTNQRDIDLCQQQIEALFGKRGVPMYYPDQRVYDAQPGEVQGMESAGIECLVLDDTSAYGVYESTARPGQNAAGLRPNANFLWQDERTSLHLLFIDTDFRNDIVSQDYDFLMGKLSGPLRQKFHWYASTPSLQRKNVLVCGDDLDKYSGCGWFDEVGHCYRYVYDATIRYIARKPWLTPVNYSQLTLATDTVGTIDVRSGIDATMDKWGATDLTNGYRLAFDAWDDNWEHFPSQWLGVELGWLNDVVEHGIAHLSSLATSPLYDLAWMSYLADLHESMWNKAEIDAPPLEPEDFVITESLQARNALVPLAAAAWAGWAATQHEVGPTHCNDGPLVGVLAGLSLANVRGCEAATCAAAQGALATLRSWHWDADPLQNIVLYNAQLLAVIDRNGGRVTHLYAVLDGVPRAISGTFKAYQFRTARNNETPSADGLQLQNTVWTPNHAYLGGDGLYGWYADGRKRDPRDSDAANVVVPGNFDAYDAVIATGRDSVTLTPQADTGTPTTPVDVAWMMGELAWDRSERQGLRPGLAWHSAGTYTKTIALTGTTLTFSYTGCPTTQEVTNEFALDVDSVTMGDSRQHVTIGAAGLATVSRAASGTKKALTAELTCLQGCGLTRDTLLYATPPSSGVDYPAYRRLHRVLTDRVDVQSTASDFSYSITIS